jgi:hypothetical protein
MDTMKPPPEFIDSARVLMWAWSGSIPFGSVGNTPEDRVFGLAICQCENSGNVYRFSCDKNWEVVQDAAYRSVEEAIRLLPDQYRNVKADWLEVEQG